MWQPAHETPVWIQAAYVGVVAVFGLGLLGGHVVDEIKERIAQRRAEEQRSIAESIREVRARVVSFGYNFSHKANITSSEHDAHPFRVVFETDDGQRYTFRFEDWRLDILRVQGDGTLILRGQQFYAFRQGTETRFVDLGR